MFACGVDVLLTASDNYSMIEHPEQAPVTLEHSNVGGHYVVTSAKGQDEFFVRVRAEQKASMLYKIQYNYVGEGEIPYRMYSVVDNTLTYTVE